MSMATHLGSTSVDLVFQASGTVLPREHAPELAAALCAHWPWLAEEALAGVHPLRLADGGGNTAFVSARTRLWLRVPVHRAADLLARPKVELQVLGHALRLAGPHARELVPHSTVYAHRVSAASAQESEFMALVHGALADQGIMGQRVCGRYQRLGTEQAPRHAFSLMLHDLTPEQSLCVQRFGLGPHRLWGCGLFVPHKSAAAV